MEVDEFGQVIDFGINDYPEVIGFVVLFRRRGSTVIVTL